MNKASLIITTVLILTVAMVVSAQTKSTKAIDLFAGAIQENISPFADGLPKG